MTPLVQALTLRRGAHVDLHLARVYACAGLHRYASIHRSNFHHMLRAALAILRTR